MCLVVLKPGLLNPGIIGIQDQEILCHGELCSHCQMFSSIEHSDVLHGFYPVDVGSNLPLVVTTKMTDSRTTTSFLNYLPLITKVNVLHYFFQRIYINYFECFSTVFPPFPPIPLPLPTHFSELIFQRKESYH